MAPSIRKSLFVAVTVGAFGLVAGCTTTTREVIVEKPAPQPTQPPPAQTAPPPAQTTPPPAQTTPPPPANGPAHPAYLHALSDLREARYNLIKKGGDRAMKWDEAEAIGDIDKAINEIKTASIDDGKNLDDHPPVDAKEPRAGRLHKALAALKAAKKDVSEEEDNAYAQGLRAKALHHIENALKHTEDGVVAAEKAS
jgi:hypothetical protein